MDTRYIGTSIRRLEDPRLLTGKGQYVDDIRVDGVLHAAFVRSPYAHARILGIEADEARALDGVVAVFTAADLGEAGLKPIASWAPPGAVRQMRTSAPLASSEVVFVGHAVAVVVAVSRHVAEDAAEMVFVDYEPLPAVVDCRRALAPDSPLAHLDAQDNLIDTFTAKFGPVDEIFATAPHVFRERYKIHRGGAHSMETRGLVAVPGLDGYRLAIWTSSQHPFGLRKGLAAHAGFAEDSLRVVAPDVGGGFGPKAPPYQEDFVVPLCADILGRPVKWIEDRKEHFLVTNQQRDQYWDVEVACDADGRMRAVRGECLHDNGAFLPVGPVVAQASVMSFPGPYALDALDVTLKAAFTNMVAVSPVRGSGRPNACFVLERLADLVARELGLDRAEVRRRSFIRADQFPYATGVPVRQGQGMVCYDSGDYHKCLETVLAVHAGDFEARRAAARAQGRYLGRGLASYIEDTGRPLEGARVRHEGDGRFSVATGAGGQGQGLETILAQIVADAVGVTPGAVTVTTADTAAYHLAQGTVGSRTAVTAGSSAHAAGQMLRARLETAAKAHLDAGNRAIVLEDGWAFIEDAPDVRIAIAELAEVCQREGDLGAAVDFDAKGQPYASGSQGCEVEVDIGTGFVRLTRYVVAHDCGRVIHPGMVDGQVRGGVVHGIGNALFEHILHDDQGTPLNTNYGEYLLTTAPEVPRIEIHHIETLSPLNPLGIKGAGEGGTIPAAACIISAIEDALSEFGLRLTEHPVAPPRLLGLIDEARAARVSG